MIFLRHSHLFKQRERFNNEFQKRYVAYCWKMFSLCTAWLYDSNDCVTWAVCSLSLYFAPLLHLQVKRLNGHQRAKNNPHLPTTQEKPFEVVVVFPLPSSPPLSQDTAFWTCRGGTSKAASRGIEQSGRRWGGSDETRRKGKTSHMKREEESGMPNAAPLHYVIIRSFFSSRFITSCRFFSYAASTACQLLDTIRLNEKRHLLIRCDPTR